MVDHREASTHALWAVALRWFDDEFFHQPITSFISTNIAFTSDNRSAFSRGPPKFLQRVYPSQVAKVLGEQAEPSVVAQEPSQKTGTSGPTY